MRTLAKSRKYLRHLFVVTFVATLVGGGVLAAYAHGQQGDDCPPGSTDPDCKKR